MSVHLILLIFAAVCFALAALELNVANGKLNLVALGLLAWVLTLLI